MMTPRLKTSKKWTPIPPELCGQIRDVFTENFAKLPNESQISGQFFVNGRVYPQEMLLQIGYLPQGRLRQANFEVSIDFDAKKQNALELIHFAVDCAASLLQEYFEADEDLENFPAEWLPSTIDNRTVYIQTTTVNTALEAEADRLLGRTNESLVQGDDPDEEEIITKKAVVSMLGLGDADDTALEVSTDESTDSDADASKPKGH